MYAEPFTESDLEHAFDRARAGKALDLLAAEKFKSGLLHMMAVLDHQRGWVQQFHLGALRNNNSRGQRTLGPDKGFDSIGDFEQAKPSDKLSPQVPRQVQLGLYGVDGGGMVLA